MTKITVQRRTVQHTEDRTVDEVEWQAEELEIVEQANGPAMSALLAAGIGVFVLGLLTTLAEANADVADWLNFKNRVGPLSGKTIMAVVAYVVSWAVFAPLLWKRSVAVNTVLIVTGVLIAAGFVGTFPKFFDLFA